MGRLPLPSATRLAFGSSAPGNLAIAVCGPVRLQPSAIGVALAAEAPLPLLLPAGALFGGFGIPIYSLRLAAAKRRSSGSRRLGTARGLLSAQWDRDSRWPLIGAAAMNIVGPGGLFLCASVSRYPRGDGPRMGSQNAAQDQGHPLSEHADDHGISRYDDTNPGGVSARSVLARRLRQRRPMQRLLQNPKQPANRPLHRPHRRVVNAYIWSARCKPGDLGFPRRRRLRRLAGDIRA